MEADHSECGARLATARFYAILDSAYVPPSQWVNTCRLLIEGGADLVQLRAKNESHRERRALLKAILPLFAEASTPLIINDDIDLALAYPGLGLHVGQDDLPVEKARDLLGPDRILGLSTHSPQQATDAITRADLLDYFAVGPVFTTPTKPTYQPVGLAVVSAVAAMRPSLPWFCIGGIKFTNLAHVLRAGAKRVVVVSEILRSPTPAQLIQQYLSRIPHP